MEKEIQFPFSIFFYTLKFITIPLDKYKDR